MENLMTRRINKVTIATLKSFIRKNKGKIYANFHISFDGMTDGLESIHNGWNPAQETIGHNKHTLGIRGVWVVGRSKDYCTKYSDDKFDGIEVSNSCGNFTLGVKK